MAIRCRKQTHRHTPLLSVCSTGTGEWRGRNGGRFRCWADGRGFVTLPRWPSFQRLAARCVDDRLRCSPLSLPTCLPPDLVPSSAHHNGCGTSTSGMLGSLAQTDAPALNQQAVRGPRLAVGSRESLSGGYPGSDETAAHGRLRITLRHVSSVALPPVQTNATWVAFPERNILEHFWRATIPRDRGLLLLGVGSTAASPMRRLPVPLHTPSYRLACQDALAALLSDRRRRACSAEPFSVTVRPVCGLVDGLKTCPLIL